MEIFKMLGKYYFVAKQFDPLLFGKGHVSCEHYTPLKVLSCDGQNYRGEHIFIMTDGNRYYKVNEEDILEEATEEEYKIGSIK
jgi:hypothetical protein